MTKALLYVAICRLMVAGVALADTWNPPRLTSYLVTPFSGIKVLADTNPVPGILSDRVEVTACAGEYEPFSVVLRASGAGVRNVNVTAGDLVGSQNGFTISAENIDIRIVKPWFQGYTGWSDINRSSPEDFRQVMVPELLLKDDSLIVTEAVGEKNLAKIKRGSTFGYQQINEKRLVDSERLISEPEAIVDSQSLQVFSVPADSNKQLWFTVHVPLNAPAGFYDGHVQIGSSGSFIAAIRVRLRVLPYVLNESPITYSMYYRSQLDERKAGISSEYKSSHQMRSELEDMKAHGVLHPTLYQRYSDEKGIKESLKLRQDVGLSAGPLFYLGLQTTEHFLGTPLNRAVANLRRMLPGLMGILRSGGANAVFIYGKDEARGDALSAQLPLWRAVHDAGGKVFVAGYAGSYQLVGGTLDILVHYGPPDFREAERWHVSGHSIFSYANPQTGPENPLLFRLNYGVVLWASGYDGAMDYAYQHCFGSCWNDLDHPKYRDHNLTYPTSHGVVPTLAWEGFREAVDDVRYIATLEHSIEANEGGASLAVTRASRFLSELKADILSRHGRSGKYNENMHVDLDAIRRQVVMHLDELAAE